VSTIRVKGYENSSEKEGKHMGENRHSKQIDKRRINPVIFKLKKEDHGQSTRYQPMHDQ